MDKCFKGDKRAGEPGPRSKETCISLNCPYLRARLLQTNENPYELSFAFIVIATRKGEEESKTNFFLF